MYYETRYRNVAEERDVDWVDVLFNFDEVNLFKVRTNNNNATITLEKRQLRQDKSALIKLRIGWLHDFNTRHEDLFEAERSKLYHSFRIPKKSGGLRQIDAPLPPLMRAMRELRDELSSWGTFWHTSAYAYIPKRCALQSLRVHQHFRSEYYLKTDLSNFFGSTTEEFVWRQIGKIPEFANIMINSVMGNSGVLLGEEELKKALSLAFLNGGLPQGNPISNFLTNLIMIPVDFKLANAFSSRKLVYTRYADDMLITGREKFPWTEMVNMIREVFKEESAPYIIKNEKTRFGSIKGSNFNLGLCTNADNNITVGHNKKKIFKAMVNNFILDTKNGTKWDIDDVTHMSGLLSYYRMVEKDYFDNLIERYNKKYNVNFQWMVNMYLNH